MVFRFSCYACGLNCWMPMMRMIKECDKCRGFPCVWGYAIQGVRVGSCVKSFLSCSNIIWVSVQFWLYLCYKICNSSCEVWSQNIFMLVVFCLWESIACPAGKLWLHTNAYNSYCKEIVLQLWVYGYVYKVDLNLTKTRNSFCRMFKMFCGLCNWIQS